MKLLSANFGQERTKGLVFHCEALTMLHESVNNLGFTFTKPVPGCAITSRGNFASSAACARALTFHIHKYIKSRRRRRRNKTTRSARAFHI
jgi:hypothetical protein